MTHVNADIIDWELGVIAGVMLVKFVLGYILKR